MSSSVENAAVSAPTRVKSGKVAERINGLIDSLHDKTVSSDPFLWPDSDDDRKKRLNTYEVVKHKLLNYKHVSKKGAVTKLILFGVLPPLLVIGAMYFAGLPQDEDSQLYVYGGLALISTVFGIIAFAVGYIQSIDSDLTLAAYAIPRGWSFSRMNQGETWDLYRNQFSYFDRGDENRYIGKRLWGYLDDNERTRPFQMFHFHYDEVTEELYYDSVSKSWETERVVHPYDRYGVFAAMKESRARFRVTELDDSGNFDKKIRLEYGKLNKSVNVYCNSKDEMEVIKFLSPAVQEEILKMSDGLSGMQVDFYDGFVFIATENDLFGDLRGVRLDENTFAYEETIKPSLVHLDNSVRYFGAALAVIKKYNDNY